MKKFKIQRWKIIVGSLVIVFFMIIGAIRHDMNLDIDVLRDKLNELPDLAFENIHMTREISGDLWKVNIPLVSQEDLHLKLQSLDISRTLENNKGEWLFFGREGIYSHDQQLARINDLTGTLNNGLRELKIKSPGVNWSAIKNALEFPNGLTVYDDALILSTSKASLDKTGVILLNQGGVIKWSRSNLDAKTAQNLKQNSKPASKQVKQVQKSRPAKKSKTRSKR